MKKERKKRTYKLGKNCERMWTEAHNAIPIEKHLPADILELLCSCYFLRAERPDYQSALDNLKEGKFLQLLHDEIIVRLCKYRDTDNRSVSFSQIVKALRKHSMKAPRLNKLGNKIEQYHQLTENLENHRNDRIAHKSKRAPTRLKPPVEMLDAIRLAVEITDLLNGTRCRYRVLDIDLREAVLGEQNPPESKP